MKRPKIFKHLVFLLLVFLNLFTLAQSNVKKGGVCFRVDENPSLIKLHQYDSLFSIYQQNFCMAMTSWVFPITPAYVDSLKIWINKGHEVMDNTPTHQTQFFNLIDVGEDTLYLNKPGVDHINAEKVCLRINSIDTTQPHNEGLVDVSGNLVISHNPGEFADLSGNPYYFALYLSIPYNNVYLWYDLRASNPGDVDSVYIKSFWEEPVSLAAQTGLNYHKLMPRNVIMDQNAVRLLGKRSLKIYSDLDIPRPYTWIHPSGQMPWISAYELKWNMGDSLQYCQGSNYINYAKLCYNEYSPYQIAPFSMQDGLSNETQDLQTSKHIIADAIAQHYVKIDLARFKNSYGGWDAYLQRTDSLLDWCITNNIPVKTYAQWKALLYDSIPNRVTNIFPALNVDLDLDLYPDGYDQNQIVSSVFDTTDGVEASGYRCFTINGYGYIFQINALAGLESGMNKFTLWTKGQNDSGSYVTLRFEFPERGIYRILDFPADTNVWTEHFQLFNVPDSVSFMTVYGIHYDGTPDTIKISGMSMRSAGFLKQVKYPQQVEPANDAFSSILLNNLVIDSLYAPSTITWTVQNPGVLNLSILPGNILKIQKPVSFWVGSDSSYLIAHSPDDIADSCMFSFKSIPIEAGCGGTLPITLTLLDTLDNDVITWTSRPFDPSISNPHIYNPTVNPLETTMYTVQARNPIGGNIYWDSIEVKRYAYPNPGLPADTSICKHHELELIASGGVSYLWSTGDTTESIIVSPLETQQYTVIVTNEYNCSAGDTVIVTVLPIPDAVIFGIQPTYCQDYPPFTIPGWPSGGVFGGTSGVEGDTLFPARATPGLNQIWYTVTDTITGCSNTDTAYVTIFPQPVITPLPDAELCANNSITLNAGTGFDNYLWSTGENTPSIVVDSTGHGIGLSSIWVYVTLNGCVDRDTSNITFILCPGIPEYDYRKLFSIYPNPASEEIWISLTDKAILPVYLDILDLNGEKMNSVILGNKTNKLDISQYSKGIYILKLSSGDDTFYIRILRK
jgi:hypothetical protein